MNKNKNSISLKKGDKLAVYFILGVTAFIFLIIAPTVGAQTGVLFDPTGADNLSTIAGATGSQTSFREIIKTILNYALGFLGLIATIFIIYGGVRYVTSGGGEGVGKAKETIMFAVIGLVIILISTALVNAILTAAM